MDLTFIQVKSSELKILETQTSQFEAEMSRLSKAIHTLQGEVQDDVDSGTIDYEVSCWDGCLEVACWWMCTIFKGMGIV